MPPVLMQEDPAGGLDGGGGRGEEESGEGVVGDAEMSDGARDVRDVGGACPQTVPATEEVRERLRARERERERPGAADLLPCVSSYYTNAPSTLLQISMDWRARALAV